MKSFKYSTYIFLFFLLLSGCAGKISSSVRPNQDLSQIKNVYIIKNTSVKDRGPEGEEIVSQAVDTAFFENPAMGSTSLALGFVEKFLTERAMAKLGSIAPVIKKELELYGINATIVEEKDLPADAKIVVRYLDVWMWDLKAVLYELGIAFISKKDNTVIASSHYKIGSKNYHDFPSPEEEIPKMFKTLFK